MFRLNKILYMRWATFVLSPQNIYISAFCLTKHFLFMNPFLQHFMCTHIANQQKHVLEHIFLGEKWNTTIKSYSCKLKKW